VEKTEIFITMTSPEGFVGVHIGAGQHSEARTALYLSVCAKACQVAVDVLKQGGAAIDAASAATMVLEDAGETNAGYGSNLTELGTVEMDAGLMDGESLLFGAVGAVPGIKNPILVAKLLVQEQRKGLLPLGRVPPGFLVGCGARDWAQRHGVPVVSEQSLISEKAAKLYKHYKKKLDSFRQSIQHNKRPLGMTEATADAPGRPNKRPNHSFFSHALDDRVTDTVS
jgi:taspase (threonine aspartase 1)